MYLEIYKYVFKEFGSTSRKVASFDRMRPRIDAGPPEKKYCENPVYKS
jgi:hypothetical protein